jgi:hypothetical protein
MYPLQCAAGYPNPVKRGKFEVYQVTATITDIGATARIQLIDSDAMMLYANGYQNPAEPQIIDIKVLPGERATVEGKLSEPVKLRKGISIVNADNIDVGSLKVYVR